MQMIEMITFFKALDVKKGLYPLIISLFSYFFFSIFEEKSIGWV